MWRALDLDNDIFVVKCTQTEGQIECNLFNLKECWSEKLSCKEIYNRAKFLNKRIQLDEEIISEIIIKQEFEKATRKDGGKKLLLKYRVETCPFYFEWNLHKHNELTFQQYLILPLMTIMDRMYQQISELSEVLHKKEVEIQQYKAEGAVLRRKTVATEKYNFKACNNHLKDVENVGKCLKKLTNLQPNVSHYVQKQKLEQKDACIKSPRMKKIRLRSLEKPASGMSYINSQSESEEVNSTNLFHCEAATTKSILEKLEQTTNKSENVNVCTNENSSNVMEPRNLKKPCGTQNQEITMITVQQQEKSQIDIKRTYCYNNMSDIQCKTSTTNEQNNQLKQSGLNQNNLEIEDLFSWKVKPKLSEPESLTNLWTALKDLDNQRLAHNS